jgi:rare lipoprotein A
MRKPVAVVGLMAILLSVFGGTAAESSHAEQVGWASWYGRPHHGRKTASGEPFSMWQLTAAHRSLPLGTKAVVTNLETGQQVVVLINDRGPFVDQSRRLIDLSWAAAKRIGLVQRGVGLVRVDVVERARTRQKIPAALTSNAG